jgi:hypothetical protein
MITWAIYALWFVAIFVPFRWSCAIWTIANAIAFVSEGNLLCLAACLYLGNRFARELGGGNP